MSLFFIGCSFTYGDDLVNREETSWPALVAKEQKKTFVNAAVSGGSNDRIVYQVIKNINKFSKFYIAWTSIARFTRYHRSNNFEVNFTPTLSNGCYGSDTNFLNYGKIHYADWYNELYSFKLWLQQIILLQRYLDANNKQWLMVNAFPNNINRWCSGWNDFNNNVKLLLCFDQLNDQQLFSEHQEIQELLCQINFLKFPGWGSWTIKEISAEYPLGATNHPLEEANCAIADYIIKHDSN